MGEKNNKQKYNETEKKGEEKREQRENKENENDGRYIFEIKIFCLCRNFPWHIFKGARYDCISYIIREQCTFLKVR